MTKDGGEVGTLVGQGGWTKDSGARDTKSDLFNRQKNGGTETCRKKENDLTRGKDEHLPLEY